MKVQSDFFVVAKGHFSIKQSLIKIVKLPSIYALGLGLICNISKVEFSTDLLNYLDYFKGAYAILGMMMIGMGLKGLASIGIDKTFMGFAFGIKFIIYPLIVLFIIWIDSTYFMFFTSDLYKVMFIFAIVPMAGNTVAIASLLNVHPEKASLAVVLSTFYVYFLQSPLWSLCLCLKVIFKSFYTLAHMIYLSSICKSKVLLSLICTKINSRCCSNMQLT